MKTKNFEFDSDVEDNISLTEGEIFKAYNITESATKRKKKKEKALGWFPSFGHTNLTKTKDGATLNPNAGNVELNVGMFNRMSAGTEAPSSPPAGPMGGGMGEALEMDEKIEKHDTLNPILWNEDKTLKPEIKSKIEEIVKTFVDGLAEDKIKFDIKDTILIGSNCNYNYTKDSDLDVHIIADSKGLDCSKDVYNLLYSAYRSLFNKDYEITLKNIPIELYVEMDGTSTQSNGVYSLKNGWIKEPVQQDIPDINQEEFDKKMQPWKDKYFNLMEPLVGANKIGKKPSTTSDDINKLIEDIYDLRQKDMISKGEYGVGNLIFKEFRNLGYLDVLKKAKKDLLSKELSLESLQEAFTDDQVAQAKEKAKKIFDTHSTAYAVIYGIVRKGEKPLYFDKPLIKYNQAELDAFADAQRASSRSKNDSTIYTLFRRQVK